MDIYFWIVVCLVLLPILYYILEGILRIFKVGDYKNKTVMITGCDSGFGRALAIRLDNLGFVVIGCCFTNEGRESLERSCSNRLTTLHLDVTDEKSRLGALEAVQSRLPKDQGLYALVNNAGIFKSIFPSELCPLDIYRQTFEVNFFGAVEMTRLFLPLIRKARGRLVFMSSIVARSPFVTGPYSASKAALRAFGEVMRKEMLFRGVKVCIVEPGSFSTNLTTKILNDSESTGLETPDIRETYAAEIEFAVRFHIAFDGTTSKDFTPVIDAYTHAVTARYPRTHYLVGTDARYMIYPLVFLPTWVSDYVLAKVMRYQYEASK